jgi:hypothetical protein
MHEKLKKYFSLHDGNKIDNMSSDLISILEEYISKNPPETSILSTIEKSEVFKYLFSEKQIFEPLMAIGKENFTKKESLKSQEYYNDLVNNGYNVNISINSIGALCENSEDFLKNFGEKIINNASEKNVYVYIGFPSHNSINEINKQFYLNCLEHAKNKEFKKMVVTVSCNNENAIEDIQEINNYYSEAIIHLVKGKEIIHKPELNNPLIQKYIKIAKFLITNNIKTIFGTHDNFLKNDLILGGYLIKGNHFANLIHNFDFKFKELAKKKIDYIFKNHNYIHHIYFSIYEKPLYKVSAILFKHYKNNEENVFLG